MITFFFLSLIHLSVINALAPLEPPQGSFYFGPWYERLNGDYPTSINQRLEYNVSFFHSDFNLTDDCQPQEIDIFLDQVAATNTNAIVYMTIYPMQGFQAVADAALQTLTLKIVGAVSRGTRIFIRYASEMNGNWFAYGQRPLEFLDSWKWVVSTIRKATNYSNNVAFIWAPNSGNGYPFPLGEYFISKDEEPEQYEYLDTNKDGKLDINDDPYTPYYPGDEWVDWVGFSIYHYGNEYPWEQNVLPPLGKFEAIMVGDLTYNATFHFYEMFSGSGFGGQPESRSRGGKPFMVTETGSTFHLAKKGNDYWYSLNPGPGRVAIKQAWWRQYLNSTFLDMYPKLKGISTFEFTKFEETTWRDFTNMGDTGTGINSPFGNDAGPSDGPVLEALKQDLAVVGSRISWASYEITVAPKHNTSKQAANSGFRSEFSILSLFDSVPSKSPLPPLIALVGWAVGSLAGMSIGLYHHTHSGISFSALFISLELIAHYTLLLARDPKSDDLSCIMEPLKRNFIVLIAMVEGMLWRNGSWTRTGSVFLAAAVILKAASYSIEYVAMQTKIYLKRADLEKVSKNHKQVESLLIYSAWFGWIGYCLLLNGLFSGLYCIWMLVSDQVFVIPMPKLSVAVKGMKWFSQEHTKQSVFHRGAFLGVFTGFGLVLSVMSSAKGMGIYLMFLSIFHLLEYVCLAVNTTQVTLTAFLLNHSMEYNLAIAFSMVEYVLEWYLFPSMKSWNWMTNVAILIALSGQIVRSLAMLTAKSNFTHIVRMSKTEGHELVKAGVYKYLCHPSYTGFFYWAVSLQIVLMNPFCFLAYIKTLSNFFSNRLITEEASLVEFFSQDYIDYRKETWLLIPEI